MNHSGFSFRPPRPHHSVPGAPYRAPSRVIATVSAPRGDEIDGAPLYLNPEAGGDPTVTLPPYAQFNVMPTQDPEAREVVTIAGASGGGKSWLARAYADAYHTMWPKRHIYVISALKKDATLDTLRFLERLDVQSFVDDPLEPGEEQEGFKKSLVIFDDCEALQGKVKSAVQSILDALLTLGRHSATSVIVCNHLPARGKETRLLLSETTLFVVFPQAMGYHTLQYLCNTHIGLSPKEIQDLRHIRSRWVALSKSYPRYILSSNEAKIL